MTSAEIDLSLTMIADWRIGSGFGRQGSIDNLVLRDARDLPYAPASTVAAMWRDAAEQLAHGLDTRDGGAAWQGLVTSLFGNQPSVEAAGRAATKDASGPSAPAQSRIGIGNFHLTEAIAQVLAKPEYRSLRKALCFVKPGVRIDPRSETAMSDMLRFEETTRRGGRMTARAHLDLDGVEESSAKIALAFALAALRLVRRVGADRRRGMGKCLLDAESVSGGGIDNVASAITTLRDCAAPAEFLRLTQAPLDIAFGKRRTGDTTNIRLGIRALQPLLITRRRLGNVVTCEDHVPGTFLLPLVTRALADAGVPGHEISRMVTGGQLAIAPAYPVIAGQRALPAPMRWRYRKSDADLAHLPIETDPQKGDNAPVSPAQWVHPKDGDYVATVKDAEDSTPQFQRRGTALFVRTHNTVEDQSQKPNQTVGGVYSYEAIVAGEQLEALIRLPKHLGKQVIENVAQVLSGEESIGAVRQRGYGGVALDATVLDPTDGCANLPDGTAVLWLVSDLCLDGKPRVTNERPMGVDGAIEAVITAAIGRPVRLADSWLRTDRRDGWHRRWGLSRPSLPMVNRGSVLIIEPVAGGDFTKEELTLLEVAGCGARRAEGFGQVLVNHLAVVSPHLAVSRAAREAVQQVSRQDKVPTLDRSDHSFARQIEDAAWRSYIDETAELYAGDIAHRQAKLGWTRDAPSASQIGKMRGLLAGAGTEAGIATVRDWLATKPKGWDEAGPKLLALLDDPFDLAGDGQEASSGFFPDLAVHAPSALTRSLAETTRDPDLQRYAIAAIIAAAARAHKRETETIISNEEAA